MGSTPGPTQTGEGRDATQHRWLGRPVLARIVRALILLAPIAVAAGFSVAMAWVVPASRLGVNRWLWWFAVIGLSSIVLRRVDAIVGRMAPLATLLQLSLVFPDEAPQRYKAAMRGFSARAQQRRIDEVRRSGEAITESDARGAQMLDMLALLSDHDRMTRGHSERVRAYSELIGREMGLTAEELAKLNWAALLHDLGKLAVPGEILNKPGRPSDAEWQLLQAHPMAGLPLSKPVAGWLGEWRAAMSGHHERWDGNGYPKGLAGEGIPLAARIVAVADAYDVMTSTRSYKKPFPSEVARREVAENAGTQFCPTAARAFLSIPAKRLKKIAGPVAWLSNLPGLRTLPVVEAAGTAAVGVAGAAAAVVAGVVLGPALVDDVEDGGAAVVENQGGAPATTAPGDAVEVPGSAMSPGDEGSDGVSLPDALPSAIPTNPGAPTTTPSGETPGAGEGGGEPTETVVTTPGGEVVNRAPSAARDHFDVAQGLSTSLNVLANDSDPDDDALTVVEVGSPSHGTATISGDGTVLYSHDGGSSDSDSFSYTLADESGAVATGLVTIGVFAAEALPTVGDDAASLAEGGESQINVLANDAPPEAGGRLVLIDVVGASHGTVSFNFDGVVTYTHDGGESTAEQLLYTIEDESGVRANGTITYTINPVNDPPVVLEVLGSVAEGGSTLVDVLAVATDAEGDPLTITSAGTPESGTSSIESGQIRYQHDGSEAASDSFTVMVSDNQGGVSAAVVDIDVAPVNDTPVANADAAVVAAGAVLTLQPSTLTVNDTDAEDGTGFGSSTVTLTGGPAVRGTVSQPGGAGTDIIYAPGPGSPTTETLSYSVCDSGGVCASTTVVVTINGAVTVLISEYSGDSANSSGDFIELYNASASAVDITGWEVHVSDDATTTPIPISGTVVMPAGGFYLLAVDGPLGASRDQALSTGLGTSLGIGLHNGAEYIDTVGNRAQPSNGAVAAALLVEGVGVAPLKAIAGYDLSYTRALPEQDGACNDTDNNAADFTRTWGVLVTPTGSSAPTATCSATASPGSVSHVVIKEVRTNGDDGDHDEYTVLFNPTAGTEVITGMTLRRDGVTLATIPSFSLAPGQHYLIGNDEFGGANDLTYSSSGLTQTSDVQLFASDGVTMIDNVALGTGAPAVPHLDQLLDDVYKRRFGGCQDSDTFVDFYFSGVASRPTSISAATPC